MSSRTLSQFPTGQQRYSINFDYLSRTFVEVSLLSTSSPDTNKVLKVGDDYRFLSATTIEVLAPQTGFDIIQIRRYTSTEPLVAFKDGSVLTATDLTIAELQSLHIAEEGRDQTTELSKMYADQAALSAGAASESLSHIIKLGTSGYVPVGSFEEGGTVSLENQVLGYGSGLTLTHWRWDGGGLPKVVPAGSTPSSAGGVGVGKWIDVTDATLRGNLFSDNGSSLVNHKYSGTGAVKRSVADRLGDFLTVKDFGAKGDGIQDDTPAFQAAIDAAGWGGKVYIPKPIKDYKFKSPVYIRGPLTLQGYGGSTVARRDMPRILVDGYFDAFVLVPTLDGFRFEYGISGVHICDLMIEGPGLDTRGKCGITVDTTVNNGVYHVRECCFERNHIRYMDYGFKINGVCYLNEWYSNRVLWSGTGCEVDRVPGATEGASDQSRFFGNEFVLNNVSLRLSTEGNMGSQTIIGNTLSESNVGLVVGSHTQFCIMGNQIENNAWYGIGLNIGAGVNPACESSKLIMGNCFLFNEVDIDVAKTSTLLNGGFPFSLRIESNSFQITKSRVLRVTAPTGAQEFDSKMFIFGMDNVYSDGNNSVGTVPPSMIEALWAGYRGYEEEGKISMTALVQDSWKNVGVISVPYGHQLSIKYKTVSFQTENTGANGLVAAGFKVYKLNDGTLLRDEFGRGGSMFFSRSDVGSGLELLIAAGPNGPGNSAYIEVQYCII